MSVGVAGSDVVVVGVAVRGCVVALAAASGVAVVVCVSVGVRVGAIAVGCMHAYRPSTHTTKKLYLMM